jgi:hypothetical protein
MIYCCPSVSLAKLEILANETRWVNERVCLTIEISGSFEIFKIKMDDLDSQCAKKPYPPSLHHETKDFLPSGLLLCRVPSAQSYREYNFLINVRQTEFHEKVKLTSVDPEPFDTRFGTK